MFSLPVFSSFLYWTLCFPAVFELGTLKKIADKEWEKWKEKQKIADTKTQVIEKGVAQMHVHRNVTKPKVGDKSEVYISKKG